MYLHTSHILEHRESLFHVTSREAPCQVEHDVREWRSSDDPRSFRKRRGSRADNHGSALADTDSSRHGEHAVENSFIFLDATQHLPGIRRKDTALCVFGKLVTQIPEDLQTVLSRVITASCTSLPCAAFCGDFF